jgi:hypothetical protein
MTFLHTTCCSLYLGCGVHYGAFGWLPYIFTAEFSRFYLLVPEKHEFEILIK